MAVRLAHAFARYSRNNALRREGNNHSYDDLFSLSVKVCAAISSTAHSSNPYVAVLGEKSLFTYAGICGSLFASKAYLPLNLRYPSGRMLAMLEASRTAIIVADSESQKALEEILAGARANYTVIAERCDPQVVKNHPQHQFLNPEDFKGHSLPEIKAGKDDIAYLLFTSGTTGKPKGVPVSNGNVTAYLDYVMTRWVFEENDSFSHTFDLTFDLSVHDMMVCWLSGACLCIPSDDSPLKFLKYIRDNDITVWFSVPSAAILMDRMRLLKPGALEQLRQSFFCGEALPERIAKKWGLASAGKEVVNLYGPSETTIAISEYTHDAKHGKALNGTVSIGKLFAGQEHVLLDPESRTVHPTRGELLLGGSQLIKGYLDDPELNRQHFIELDGYPGKSWYKTGDIVEKDAAGDLFFLGRSDAEVKISGFRVNLMEIDALLKRVCGTELVASTISDKTGAGISSFVGPGAKKDEKNIMEECRKALPWYMIPEVIIFVDEMPLNDNGKIDRNKLKELLNG